MAEISDNRRGRLGAFDPRARAGVALGAILLFACAASSSAPSAQAVGPESALDARQWELVSPVEKNGGEIESPGGPGAGALQAAAGGGAVAFASDASFGTAAGAAPVSQYLATRGAGGWDSANLTPPQLSGTYEGGAYQLFSADLSRAILSNGWRCRDGGAECAAENPPLAAGAPVGYRNLYLREGGGYTPLLTTANAPALSLDPEDFDLSLAGASPDLRHVVVSTCAALGAGATEVPDGGGGCEAAATNLYEWSEGGLEPLNFLPGAGATDPGATLAAPSGAISSDGARVYWRGGDGNLYLREGGQSAQADADAGGGGTTFEAASADGAVAFFGKGGQLWRYLAASDTASELTPPGVVLGVLGASADGSYLYYLASDGLYLWHSGTTTKVAAGADASNYPAATGTARVTSDGSRLAFLSSASLTGYPNGGKTEAFVYEAPAKKLICASCNPKGTAPKGPATIPGARAAGDGPAAHQPRALAADGTRLFFDSADALLSVDTDKAADIYQWVANGTAGCTKTVGCVGLVSGGRVGSSAFADASADGTDAFFLTAAPLLPGDPGSVDLYNARAGGGFPAAPAPIPCVGDACQGPPPGPDDPAPATGLFSGRGNPPLPGGKTPRCKKNQRPKGKRCVRKHSRHRAKPAHGHGGRR